MTIDTSREAVGMLVAEQRYARDYAANLLARAEAAEAREQALLMTQTDLMNDTVLMGMARDEAIAERDAALAEVARLSLARTPADAEAHLTALLRAEYERGVRAMADMAIGALAVPQIGTVSEIVRDVQRALLTQEER